MRKVLRALLESARAKKSFHAVSVAIQFWLIRSPSVARIALLGRRMLRQRAKARGAPRKRSVQRRRALEKQIALGGVAREPCRSLEFRARLLIAPELGEEIRPHGRQ